ncbi:MAG: membrane dipeptidase, partial [Gemmatimonadaceae bacterium]|nr:membrane dipeptidase [Gemmatimonadaceae bacterium]
MRSLVLAALCVPTLVAAQGYQPPTDAALVAKARAIHDRVLTLDTHVDINPALFTATAPNYTQKLPRTQVDLAKMEEGGLDGAFLIVYVGQSPQLNDTSYARAFDAAIQKFDAIHRLTEQLAPQRAELALTAADARRIGASGKRVIFIGVENGFPLG